MKDIRQKLESMKTMIDECLASLEGGEYEEEPDAEIPMSEPEEDSGLEDGGKLKAAIAKIKGKMR